MYYTIYLVTNTINGNVYIGKHQTNDLNDGYMGSGKILKNAIKKYGLCSFQKTILHIFENEQEMNKKEAELVNEEFIVRKDTYNICVGGCGGFGYINKNLPNGMLGKKQTDFQKQRVSEWHEKNKHLVDKNKHSEMIKNGLKKMLKPSDGFTGRTHTEDTKNKMCKPKNIGESNSQFGSMWITDGINSIKIKKTDLIPEGWYKGRKT
jgi:group I intron endonuclease